MLSRFNFDSLRMPPANFTIPALFVVVPGVLFTPLIEQDITRSLRKQISARALISAAAAAAAPVASLLSLGVGTGFSYYYTREWLNNNLLTREWSAGTRSVVVRCIDNSNVSPFANFLTRRLALLLAFNCTFSRVLLWHLRAMTTRLRDLCGTQNLLPLLLDTYCR